MTPYQRILKIMNYAKLSSLVELKERLKIQMRDPRFTYLKTGQRGISRKMALNIIKEFPEVSLEWLLTGEGNFLIFRQSDPIHHKIKKFETDINDMQHKIDFVYNLKK